MSLEGRHSTVPLRCVLIGEHPLLAQCATLLLERGHRVQGIVSPVARLRRWAAERGLPATDARPGLVEWLAAAPFDYLFSAANLRLLSPEVLALPRRLPINFHDAPLPRRAGVHATSWAILEGDTSHGVTWHVMTERVDAGAVLKRRAVPVDPADTAYTLNVKCYQAGVESFAELVDELAGSGGTPVPQELSRRTYHPRFAGPPRGGLVSWRAGAEALSAAVRACDFGPHRNGFGSVVLAMAHGFALVREARPAGDHSVAPPGTVVLIEDAVTVATTTCDVRLRLATLSGEPIAPAELVARWGVRPGHRFVDAGPERAAAVVAAHRATRPHEEFWVDRLARVAPLRLPRHRTGAAASWRQRDFAVPGATSEAVLGALLAYLSMVTGGEGGDVGLRWGPRIDPCAGLDELFAPYVPVRAPVPAAGCDLAGYSAQVTRQVAGDRGRGTFARDIWARYPELQPSIVEDWPIAVDLVAELTPAGDGDAGGVAAETALQVTIPRGGRACRWRVAADVPVSLAEGFAAFLRAADDPAGRDVTRLPLLCDDDRRSVLVGWNDTAVAHPRGSCVPAMVTPWARRRPWAPAVVCAGTTLCYGELERRSNRLAAHLGRQGIGPGSIVAIYLERSTDLVVALLAIMKAGAAYLPLDAVYPPERVAVMLADARPALLLTQDSLAPGVPGGAVDILTLECAWSRTGEADGGEPYDRASPDELAYVIYTSGSTGVPKGVRVPHRALTNLLHAMAASPGFTERDRLLAVTTVCFDIAVLELLLPLVTGGCVEVAPDGVAADGFALRERIERGRPTVVQATPATWRMLLATGWGGDCALRAWCGGEALPPDLADALAARTAAVSNLYGPTETTIWSSVAAVAPGEPVTIGRPIANTRFYVLDRWMRPLPPGLPGELYIGGAGVAAGYLDRPELTRERFLTSPFVDGETLYRTGDLVCHRDDGEVEYLDRVDRQVKLRGFRIEPGEVEAVLCRYPGVRQAAIVVREDPPGDRRLVAYVVPAGSDGAPSAAQLRGYLAGALPRYMVPAAIVAVQSIPLTPNGKVDRAALRRPAQPEPGLGGGEHPRPLPGAGPAGTRTRERPATAAREYELERAIEAVWCDVLRLERVGLDDGFFDLGGDSVLLMDAVARLRAELGAPLTRVDMFRYPTVRALAGHLGQAAAGGVPRRAAGRRDGASRDALGRRRDTSAQPPTASRGGATR